MVLVQIYQDNRGYQEIRAEGHADDKLICAGVSAVMWGLAGTLVNLTEPKAEITRMSLEDGLFDIKVNPFADEENQRILNTIFTQTHIALAQLSKKYPENIKIL